MKSPNVAIIPPVRDGDHCPKCGLPFLGYTFGTKCDLCGNYNGKKPIEKSVSFFEGEKNTDNKKD